MKTIPRKLPTWPVDWDLHIINVCDLYLGGRVDFLDGISNYNFIVGPGDDIAKIKEKMGLYGVELRLLFKIHNHYYGAAVQYHDSKRVKFFVYYLVKTAISIDEAERALKVYKGLQLAQASHSLLLIQPIGCSVSKDQYKAVSQIEKMINDDYLKRDNEGGGGSGDDSNDPVEPSPSFSKNPINPQLVPV